MSQNGLEHKVAETEKRLDFLYGKVAGIDAALETHIAVMREEVQTNRDLANAVADMASTVATIAPAMQEVSKELAALKEAIGEDPDLSLMGKRSEGSGLRGSVALLMRDLHQRSRVAGVAVGTGVGLGAAIAQLINILVSQ